MSLLFFASALADSVTLDNGVVLEVDLAWYELHGDCQMSVVEGELTGAILIVPCHRVRRFERTAEALVLEAQRVPAAVVAEADAGEIVSEERVEARAEEREWLELPDAPDADEPADDDSDGGAAAAVPSSPPPDAADEPAAPAPGATRGTGGGRVVTF
jgi:hypothetical protein